jgi:phage shock protein C
MTRKKLYRSRENAMIGGVCAGLAEYFDIDPSLVRLATVLLVFPGGLSFWAYIVAWIIIPHKPLSRSVPSDVSPSEAEPAQATGETPTEVRENNDKTKYVAGIILIVLGIFFLLNSFNVFVWFSFFKLWPIILIIIGAVILIKGLNRGGVDES